MALVWLLSNCYQKTSPNAANPHKYWIFTVFRFTRILLVLVVLAGALISFLAVRSARRSYALMRIQGLSRMGLLATVLVELLLPALVGCGLAAVLWRQWLPLVLFLVCYVVGGMAAVIRPVLARPAMILRQQE